MKLSLNELRVDSYASQLSEVELTLVKGGDGDVTPMITQITVDSTMPVNPFLQGCVLICKNTHLFPAPTTQVPASTTQDSSSQ